MKNTQELRRARRGTKGRLLWIVLILAFLMLTMGAIHIHRIAARPGSLFESARRISSVTTLAPTPLFDVEPYLSKVEPKGTPIPTASPKAEEAEADPDPLGEGKPLSGIVNIALFGIDVRENGRTTSGTMPHTDTNMIVAINFDTDEVSLISIARDIFTTAPGHDGFYKFNCVFNVGGGMKDPKAGLELSCRAAEEWLGGVSVPYYFGLDYQAAIDVVDAIGGIDYATEVDLKGLDKKYIAYKGEQPQHLNGAGVLAYLRTRKMPGAGGLDSLRTARQRKMMIALFRKIKEEGQLSQIPEVLRALGEDIYTNVSIDQVTALVNYAATIDPESIRSYSIQGNMVEQYDFRYCMVIQQDRLDILKAVYGIDAEPIWVDSSRYERFLHDSGFMALQHIGYAKRLFSWIHESVAESDMTEIQKEAYALCWKDYRDMQAMFDLVNEWTKAHCEKGLSNNAEKEQRTYYQALNWMEKKLRTTGDALNEAFGSPLELKWTKTIGIWYAKDTVINEVYVDFR